MNGERPRYVAYMLRLWKVGGDDEPTWRASLENPHTGELHVFGHLQALFAFLNETMERLPDTSTPSGSESR